MIILSRVYNIIRRFELKVKKLNHMNRFQEKLKLKGIASIAKSQSSIKKN